NLASMAYVELFTAVSRTSPPLPPTGGWYFIPPSSIVICALATVVAKAKQASREARYQRRPTRKCAIIPHELCATHRTSDQERATHAFLQLISFFGGERC